ncbi:hypothetical protein L7F22_013765 [Adiantum nelumboides]|nr:hypothetical protein [Adiantum nelumboides]
MSRTGLNRGWEDRFALSILRAWELLRPSLSQQPPTCDEERARQPLIWSPLVRTEHGYMLGSRPRLAWGPLAAGPARSFGDWQAFSGLLEEIQLEQLGQLRGGQTMRADLQAALPAEWFTPFEPEALRWLGAFTHLEVLIAIRAHTQEGRCIFFEVQDAGRLIRVEEESHLVSACVLQRVRIVAAASRRWHIDPDPTEIDADWRLWVYGARPLARLPWDPGEWRWQDPFEPVVDGAPFFQYTVRLGRHILTASHSATPVAAEHWRLQGLTQEATLALRSLAYFLHNEKFIAEISDEKASAILSSICQLIMSADKTVLGSLALWCLGVQELRQKVVEAHLDLILQALLFVTDSSTYVSSKALIQQAFQVFVKLAQRYPCVRVKSSQWVPAIYRRLLSTDKGEREGADQCLKDLEFMLQLPSQGSLSEVVAVDISETFLPKMEKMIKSKASVLPAVRAWGWFVRLLGSLAGEKRTLVNQMLKIVEVTFTSQDASIRTASLVVWEVLIDALLQLPNASLQQNTKIIAGVSLSLDELEKPLLVPPLKRLKLLMVPLISIVSADKDQVVRLACWRTWHYLAHKLGTAINQPSVADVIVIPIFEAMFRFGPDKKYSSAWDLCLKALEDWICCKFKHKIDSCLSISIPGKPPSPQTPPSNGVENVVEISCIIMWTAWSLETLDVFLRLLKILWNFGMECFKTSSTRNLSLSAASRIFLLLVKGVECDGKCAVKPSKQHIKAVHSLLMFVDDVLYQHVETAIIGAVLVAVDTLIESLLDLQSLVLSSSFYKLSLAPTNSQRKFGEQYSTFLESDICDKQQEVIEVRSGDLVTPIVYLIHSWVSIASKADLSGPERETFKKRLESLVANAIRGFNVIGNLSGLASVLDFCLLEFGSKNKVDEVDRTLLTNNVDLAFCMSSRSCLQLLMPWRIIAEHTAKYLEGSNDMFAVEGVAGDSGYQVIFRILLFPFQVYGQLSSVTSAAINKTYFKENPNGFTSDIGYADLQVVLIAWLKLFDCTLSFSSRMTLQANFFASGLSQQILKLLEKDRQQQDIKEAGNGSSLFAEIAAFVTINVLKRTEPSNFAMLAINRKRRYGSYISMSCTANGVRGSEREVTSNVRSILALASRVLDFSCDKCTAGESHWLDPTARVLDELASFAARLNSQQDVLLFTQEFSKPYAKWLKFSESFRDDQDKYRSTTLTHSLQKSWQEHLHNLRKCYPPLSFDSDLLSLQALALAAAFQHSATSISNCTTAFWEASYGSKATSLKYPPCLVPVLEKLKSKSDISLPGWNRNCADASRRKSDVAYYTATGRRCLRVFQEHLMDAQKVPSGMPLPLPKKARSDKNTSCQADASSRQADVSSLPQSTGDLNSKSTGMVVGVVLDQSVKLPQHSMSGHTSMEARQAGFDSVQLAKFSLLSRIRDSTEGKVQNSAALYTHDSSVAATCSKAEVSGVVQTNSVGSLLGSLTAPNRKRFAALKKYAKASNPLSEEELIHLTEGQPEGDMDKGVPDRDGNVLQNDSTPSTSDTDEKCLKRPRKRFAYELKMLGIRRQRFLRSSGSLRGGKFWRDTSGTVRAVQKIRKGFALPGTDNGTSVKDIADNKTVRIVDEPSVLKQKEGEASAVRLLRKRGVSGSSDFAKSDTHFHAIQFSNELAPVPCLDDAGPFEKDVDQGTNKVDKLLKKATTESPFRVQTLIKGLYGKIFSSAVRRSNSANNFASRSHHRKNSCPRKIPMSRDEQSEDNQQSFDLDSNLKFKPRKKVKRAEFRSGIEFTTPSKILRSGRKLKSKKWGTFSAANKVENQDFWKSLQNSISSDQSKSLNNSRATGWYHANVGKTTLVEPDRLSLSSSKILEYLQVGDQPVQKTCEYSSAVNVGGSTLAQKECQIPFHEPGVSFNNSLLNKHGEHVETGTIHRLCHLLAHLSTSSDWSSASLDDLEYAEKLLEKLQGLIGESKRCFLIGQAANKQ